MKKKKIFLTIIYKKNKLKSAHWPSNELTEYGNERTEYGNELTEYGKTPVDI